MTNSALSSQIRVLAAALAAGFLMAAMVPEVGAEGVEVTPRPDERRVDVRIDGRPFTAYIWPDRLDKPVLFPIRTAGGTLVTRGFPLDPRPGERVDHPHPVQWFGHLTGDAGDPASALSRIGRSLSRRSIRR